MARRRTAELVLPSAQPRRFDRVLKWGVLGLVVALGLWAAPRLPDAWRWATGKPAKFRPEHPVALDRVDLRALHAEHWTPWIVAAAQATPGVPTPRLASARSTIRNAVAADLNLLGLFDELDGIVTSAKLSSVAGRQRALWLVGAWNDYVDTNGQPFFLHADVLSQRGAALVYAPAYRVVGDTAGQVGDERVRGRAISRLDRTNLRETYLGYASSADEGALLLADRVTTHALARVWPLLAGSAGASIERRPFADAVLAEARAALPAELVAELVATAPTQAAVVDAFAGMRERSGCSGLAWREMPWNGYDQEQLSELAGHVEGGACAGVHPSEFAAIRAASETYPARPQLESALARLVAWVARPVVVHELRHVADAIERGDDDTPRTCGICELTDPDAVRAEVSAYVAQLAWSDSPALALHQICVSTDGDPDEQTIHGRARAAVVTGLSGSCREGAPPDLAAQARRIEADAFGRSEAIALDPAFPHRLPLVAERDRDPTALE
ncbi:MAG TPA: hypothetical protein VFG69_08415 [Nannocystaceae bacterium]|nr:hypothetical protein [Nannocystaceae bacterium]